MKFTKVSKWVGASVLSLGLATLPVTISASAQTTPDVTGTDTTVVDTVEEDDGFDWGWLGLLGLLGLAGLAGKREEPVRYRDPADTGTRVGYRE